MSGGDEPMSAPDGSSVFYPDGAHVVSAGISDRPQLRIVNQVTLFVGRYALNVSGASYDLMSDGRGVMMVKPLTEARASEADCAQRHHALLLLRLPQHTSVRPHAAAPHTTAHRRFT